MLEHERPESEILCAPKQWGLCLPSPGAMPPHFLPTPPLHSLPSVFLSFLSQALNFEGRYIMCWTMWLTSHQRFFTSRVWRGARDLAFLGEMKRGCFCFILAERWARVVAMFCWLTGTGLGLHLS